MSLITISEGIGCGGLAIEQGVVHELKVGFCDDRRLEQEAIGLGFRPGDLKGLGEKGVVHTSGFANTAEAGERMIEVTRGVPGVPDVNSEGELIPGGSA